MKRILILLCLPLLFTTCKKEEDNTPTNNTGNTSIYTYVPDDNFEIALINLGLDFTLNDTVLTAAIDTITYLNVGSQNISDLTGIEDFSALTGLLCNNNQLTTLDVSQNTALNNLRCNSNQLTTLDVSQNTALTSLRCYNNQLTTLDVSNNTVLTDLECGGNNLTTLDVSDATALTELGCGANNLTTLDIRNGNNTNMTSMSSWDNPNLYCIDVDDANWSTANWTNIDNQSFFSEDCGVK